MIKRLCTALVILIVLVGNLFAYNEKFVQSPIDATNVDKSNEDVDSRLLIPMGLNMQIDSGNMHTRIVLLATEEDEKKTIRNRDYDNSIILTGKIITFTGIGGLVLGVILLISAPIYALVNTPDVDTDVVNALIGSSAISGVVGALLVGPGGIIWGIGKLIQNSDKKVAQNIPETRDVSYNTFNHNF